MNWYKPSTWFRSAPSYAEASEGRQARTGAVMRSTVASPKDAELMRQMFGLSSEMARAAKENNDRMGRIYDASVMDNWNRDFVGTYGTANTEIFTYFYRIWARCRTIVKDFAHGKSIVRTYVNNVVGHDPFALTMRIGEHKEEEHPVSGQKVRVFEADEELNRDIMAQWKKFCKPKNFTIRRNISMMEAMMQVEAEAVTIGSCLIRLWDGFPGNKFGFAIDLLEADRLEPNYQGFAPETNNPIRGGIEYHPIWNWPVAYWILTRHPGEFVANNYPGRGVSKGQVFRERVPAENIIHYNNIRLRAEQDRGFTELEACVQSLYMNFKYAGALTQASLASCCKPWVIEKDIPTGLHYTPSKEEYESLVTMADAQGNNSLAGQGLMPQPDPTKLQQGNSPNTEVMSPAMTKVLEWGFKMKVLDPKFPIEAAHEFRVDNYKEVAAAAGVSYSGMTGDFQSLGYIAAQMSKQPERDQFMVHQENIKMVVLEEIIQRWMRSSVMVGIFDFSLDFVEEYCDAANFKAKRWPFTDMLREVQALVLKKDARMISPQQAQDELPDGVNYHDVVAQISEAQQMEEAHGLTPLDFDPTEVVVKDTIADPGGSTPPTQKPGQPKGSKTAKGQTVQATARRAKRGVISKQVLALLGELEKLEEEAE